jgi:hypothetical protein
MKIYRFIKSFIVCLFCTSFCSGLAVATSSSVIAPQSFFASQKALRQEFLMLSQLLKALSPAMQKLFITSQAWAFKTKKYELEDVVLQEKFLDALEKDKNIDDETKELVASFFARTHQASRKKKFTRFHAIAVAGASALALAAAIVVARKVRKHNLKQAARLISREWRGGFDVAGPERGPLLLEQAIQRVRNTRPLEFSSMQPSIQQQIQEVAPIQIDLFKQHLKQFLPPDYYFDILWNPDFGWVLSNHTAPQALKTFAKNAGFARNASGLPLGTFLMNPFFLIDMYNDLLPYIDLINGENVRAFGIFYSPQAGGTSDAVCFVQQEDGGYVQVVKPGQAPLHEQKKRAIRTASFFVSGEDKCRAMVDFFTSPGVRLYVEYGVYDEALRSLHNADYSRKKPHDIEFD